jgi:hypothetical protein
MDILIGREEGGTANDKKLCILSGQKLTQIPATALRPEVISLDISNNQITHINAIYMVNFGNIRHLIISNNTLNSLEGLHVLQFLKFLDVSDNNLTSFIGIETLTSLQSFTVRNNHITKLGTLRRLGFCAQLVAIDMRGNSVTNHTHYKSKIRAMLPRIRELDGDFTSAYRQATRRRESVGTITSPFTPVQRMNTTGNSTGIDNHIDSNGGFRCNKKLRDGFEKHDSTDVENTPNLTPMSSGYVKQYMHKNKNNNNNNSSSSKSSGTGSNSGGFTSSDTKCHKVYLERDIGENKEDLLNVSDVSGSSSTPSMTDHKSPLPLPLPSPPLLSPSCRMSTSASNSPLVSPSQMSSSYLYIYDMSKRHSGSKEQTVHDNGAQNIDKNKLENINKKKEIKVHGNNRVMNDRDSRVYMHTHATYSRKGDYDKLGAPSPSYKSGKKYTQSCPNRSRTTTSLKTPVPKIPVYCTAPSSDESGQSGQSGQSGHSVLTTPEKFHSNERIQTATWSCNSVLTPEIETGNKKKQNKQKKVNHTVDVPKMTECHNSHTYIEINDDCNVKDTDDGCDDIRRDKEEFINDIMMRTKHMTVDSAVEYILGMINAVYCNMYC